MLQNIGKYTIGSNSGFGDQQLNQLHSCLEKPAAEASGTLAGRAAVATIDLEGVGSVVVKHYTRGGLIRTFNYNTYLKTSNYRCKEEFDILSKLYQAGMSIPEPIAYVIAGKLLYKAWLVTREVEKAKTLVEISVTAPDQLPEIMFQLQSQVELLVQHKIHHVDLHPGNVLIDPDNKLYLIDFDKACSFTGSADNLWLKYISRWQRALTKHQLTDKLTLTR